jgi:GntR family histidine utilization transcriptional repressor
VTKSAPELKPDAHAPAAGRTLHQQIRSSIEKQILSGAWKPGHRIPFEHELVQQYGCSRMTVNKAIGELVNAGLVVRRKRAGSFVAQPPIHSAILDIPDIQAEILERGQTYAYKLLRRSLRKPAHGRPAERELAGAGRLVDLQCLHSADGRPFALEDRLISCDAAPEVVGVDFAVTSPGAWLLGHVPWTAAEHRIAAIGASEATAALLDVPKGTACLLLERRTWRDGVAVTQVRQTFPGDSFDLIAKFTPTRAR